MNITAPHHFRTKAARPAEPVQLGPTNVAYMTPRESPLEPENQPARVPLLQRLCGSCRWKHACGGSARLRAERISESAWMPAPVCYVRDEEIAGKVNVQDEIMESDVLLDEQAA